MALSGEERDALLQLLRQTEMREKRQEDTLTQTRKAVESLKKQLGLS